MDSISKFTKNKILLIMRDRIQHGINIRYLYIGAIDHQRLMAEIKDSEDLHYHQFTGRPMFMGLEIYVLDTAEHLNVG